MPDFSSSNFNSGSGLKFVGRRRRGNVSSLLGPFQRQNYTFELIRALYKYKHYRHFASTCRKLTRTEEGGLAVLAGPVSVGSDPGGYRYMRKTELAPQAACAITSAPQAHPPAGLG